MRDHQTVYSFLQLCTAKPHVIQLWFGHVQVLGCIRCSAMHCTLSIICWATHCVSATKAAYEVYTAI